MNGFLKLAIAAASLVGIATLASAELSIGTKAPELVGTQWTNGKTSLGHLKGKVVLLHFWTFGCINCKHNLPAYARLQQDFADQAVAMVGVHTPETAEERSFENLKKAVPRLGIRFDSVFDDRGENWNRYKVQYWPTLYVVDKRGIIRGVWVGELNYNSQNGEAEVKALVSKLLQE